MSHILYTLQTGLKPGAADGETTRLTAAREGSVWSRVCFFERLSGLVSLCPPPQVSFYRGQVPGDLPQEVASRRKGWENQWLATLPLRLPVSLLI